MSVVSICIGKVVEITNTYISIMLTDSTQRPYKIIDGIPIRIGGVGDFVRVDSDVYEITNVKTTLDKVAGKHTQADTQKILLCTLIGYFKGGKFSPLEFISLTNFKFLLCQSIISSKL